MCPDRHVGSDPLERSYTLGLRANRKLTGYENACSLGPPVPDVPPRFVRRFPWYQLKPGRPQVRRSDSPGTDEILSCGERWVLHSAQSAVKAQCLLGKRMGNQSD
jgi:hypothetical protein